MFWIPWLEGRQFGDLICKKSHQFCHLSLGVMYEANTHFRERFFCNAALALGVTWENQYFLLTAMYTPSLNQVPRSWRDEQCLSLLLHRAQNLQPFLFYFVISLFTQCYRLRVIVDMSKGELYGLWTVMEEESYRTYSVLQKKKFNFSHPNSSMHILHIVLYTFPLILTSIIG